MKTSFRWPGAIAPLVLRCFILSLALFSISLSVFGQANGKLQIHYIDVGQGDGAIVISPLGEALRFDSGVRGLEKRPIVKPWERE